jgi:hypothetical protein
MSDPTPLPTPVPVAPTATPTNAPPIPPREPDVFDCCNNECGDACVWTIYYRLKKKYDEDLEAWQIAQLLAE